MYNMEPMTLGSPTNSPSGNAAATHSPFLPAFLMGDLQTPITPNTRSNTLSPNKGGKSLTFAHSPNTNSPDYNRSAFAQKTVFSGVGGVGYPKLSPANCSSPTMSSINAAHQHQQQQQQTPSITAGPPIQGLFDTLLNERNQVQTPTQQHLQQEQQYHTPIAGLAQNMQHVGTPFNDSYFTNNSFNGSRMLSPLMSQNDNSNNVMSPIMNTSCLANETPTSFQQRRSAEFWITVYGFPPNALSAILKHFSQCGLILNKVLPSNGANWMHLKYSSRIECDRALNYNETILNNNIMIGVVQCKETRLVERENMPQLMNSPQAQGREYKLRSLSTGNFYKSPLSETNASSLINTTETQAQRTTGGNGIINKAMDLFFGW